MRQFFEDNLQIIGAALDGFAWADRISYASALAQLYYCVAHSTRLLAVSAAHFDVADEALHRQFALHMAEEKSHHLLALHDLTTLGFELPDFPELGVTAALYESQYYKAAFRDPSALFGYMLVLDGIGLARGEQLHAAVVQAHGIDSATFLAAHAQCHAAQLEPIFSAVARLSPVQQKLVRQNFVQSSELFGLMLDAAQLVAVSKQGRPQVA